MNKILHFRTFFEKGFKRIWKDEKIASRTRGMCILVPVLLTTFLIFSQLLFFKSEIAVPYVILFGIIVVSACYGGYRSVFPATLITFIAEAIYHFSVINREIMMLMLYLALGLFFTALLHYFLKQQELQKIQLLETGQNNDELVRIEESHEDFVNMATHELKLPVTVLKAYAQMIHLKSKKPGFTESYLEIIDKMDGQLDKLLNIISDLQDAVQAKSDSLNCLMNNFNINDSLRNVDGILLSHPGVVVEFDLAYPDVIVNGDKERIEQVINNFIGNGLKYSGADKFIKISSKINDGWLKVTIEDHGYGIPAEKQPYIFDRFFRAGTSQLQKLPGLGLGLFICKEIIKQHNGKIGVNSEVGKGSEFWFCLPVI